MKEVISIKNLTKKYGSLTALDQFSLTVKEGEILGLLGPNGSGKSTSINCMLSLLKYDSGSVELFGKKMSPDAYDIKEKIGVVFQDVAVFDELTVYKNIDYFCGLYIKDKKTRAIYVKEAIELVGLQDFQKFNPKQLSGGLLRRLNIACGIAHKPKLIFFDEPTVAVDPQSRNNILEGIKKLNREGATIIYTTHYMEEVEQLCDRIVIIDHGKTIASGTKQELKELANIEEKVTIEFDKLPQNLASEIEKMKHVSSVEVIGNTIEIAYRKGTDNLGKLMNALKEKDLTCKRVFSELPTLNDVFLTLTGKDLRD